MSSTLQGKGRFKYGGAGLVHLLQVCRVGFVVVLF